MKKFFHYLDKGEEWLLSLLLIIMIVLACTQIVLRSAFSSGLLWIDPLLRYLVLWTGFLGAAMATSKGKHIALDIISYLVPQPAKTVLEGIANVFSMVVSALLTWAAYLFIKDEYAYGGQGLLELPTWFWTAIFPIAFAIITIRFGSLAIQSFISLLPSHGTKADIS